MKRYLVKGTSRQAKAQGITQEFAIEVQALDIFKAEEVARVKLQEADRQDIMIHTKRLVE